MIPAQNDEPKSIEWLLKCAHAWMDLDQDPNSRRILEQQIDAQDIAALHAGFSQSLTFGTAGLRGEVGPGPGRINLETIAQVSWALGRFLIDGSRSKAPLVVMGFDARPDSARFADQAAKVLSGLGVRVLLTEGPQPTPLIAFAVRDLNASAGVVVTASHNPRPDNGYKVYDQLGVQMVSPWDTQIAENMRNFPGSQNIFRHSDYVLPLGGEVIDRYFAHVDAVGKRWVPHINLSERRELAYTPLHGVGIASVMRATQTLPVDVISVSEQAVPDGSFPTLEFPNPEEPGALDLLLTQARTLGISAAAAHDPDADRFALCLPLDATDSPSLTRLSGDALGLLLTDLCLSQSSGESPCVVSTVVSTPALEALVERRGGRIERTLTGFKWLCRAALEQPGFVFAYEEALGYCLAGPRGSAGVMDKDGISALVTVARLLSQCGGGDALAARLLSIYCEIGLWGSFGHSRRYGGIQADSEMHQALDHLRARPPTEILGMRIASVTDYELGAEQRPWYLGAQNLLQFDLVSDSPHLKVPHRGRVLIRPSGTEPKVKVYVHLCSAMSENGEYAELLRSQEDLSRRIFDSLLGA